MINSTNSCPILIKFYFYYYLLDCWHLTSHDITLIDILPFLQKCSHWTIREKKTNFKSNITIAVLTKALSSAKCHCSIAIVVLSMLSHFKSKKNYKMADFIEWRMCCVFMNLIFLPKLQWFDNEVRSIWRTIVLYCFYHFGKHNTDFNILYYFVWLTKLTRCSEEGERSEAVNL